MDPAIGSHEKTYVVESLHVGSVRPLRMLYARWLSLTLMASLLSVESSSPMQIDDADCTVGALRSEQTVFNSSTSGAPQRFPDTTLLELLVPIAKMVPQFRAALRLPTIPATTLQALEQELDSLALQWPEPFHPYTSGYIAPSFVWISATFFSLRVFLHRHNLSPLASPDARANALAACTSAAHGTVHIINRSLLASPADSPSSPRPPSSAAAPSWEQRVRVTTPAHLCTHLWRCTLLLTLSLDFSAALTCARLSAAVGSLRKINQACGRHLTAYLERLAHRLRTPPLLGLPPAQQRHRLALDEEMLAIVSADAQADTYASWIWSAGASASPDLAVADSPPNDHGRDPETGSVGSRPSSGGAGVGGAGGVGFSSAGARDDFDDADWGGWPRVEAMLRELARDQQSSAAGSASSVGSALMGPGASEAPPPLPQLHPPQPPPPAPPAPGPAPFSPGGGSERIRIANIM